MLERSLKLLVTEIMCYIVDLQFLRIEGLLSCLIVQESNFLNVWEQVLINKAQIPHL